MKTAGEGPARVALVSGASGVIGGAIARRLAQKGHPVVLCGRDGQKLRALADDIATSTGAFAFPRPCDLSNADALESAVNDVHARFDAVDILVHAAGDGPVAGFFDATEAEWSNTLTVKMLGAIRLTRLIADRMVRRGRGRVVLVNGTFAQQPHPMFIVNSTVNAALRGFAKALSMELGAKGVTVNTVNPGITLGALWSKTAHDLAEKLHVPCATLEEQLRSGIPLGRFATGDDVAEVVAFLASPAAAYLNGAVINVDGGGCAAA